MNHPHIWTLHDIGPNYLIMEFIEGETLAQRLKRGKLSIEENLRYGGQIAGALTAAHAKGIIHRDLKPGNVMLTKQGVKVLDFGLAKSAEDETFTTSRAVMGTPAYMPPEQREGKAADARADIYSLGCVLYEMSTGARAGSGERVPSQSLEKIVTRCLETDRERRWQSVAELERGLSGLAESAPPWRATATAALVVLVFAAGGYFYLHRAPKLTDKDTIVLADFDNQTGASVFGLTLRQGLAVQLELSPFLRLLPDDSIEQARRLMNRPSGTRLTPEIAREICERTGSTAVLEGSITSLGSQYVLWLRARNCRTGEALAQEQSQAGRREDVLNALSRIAVQVRSQLGESLATIREHSTPLEQATTSSLEALEAYSNGRSALLGHDEPAAIPHFQRAIAIDPLFAMAYGDLSMMYWNVGQTALSAENTRKAYELRDRVSNRERLWILFLYDRQVTGNLSRELQTLESWVHSYPRDWLPLSVLAGWGTLGTGQYERGLQAAQEAFRLNPDSAFSYVGSFHSFLMDRFAEAADTLQRAAERKLEIPQMMNLRYYLAFFKSNQAGMEQEIARAPGEHAEDWMSHNQAMVLARSGQLRQARAMWERAVDMAQQDSKGESAALYKAAEAVCEAHFGNAAVAKERARAALQLARGRDVEYAAAFALALAGDSAGSQRLAADLERRFPEDTPVQFEYLPTLRALSALVRREPL